VWDKLGITTTRKTIMYCDYCLTDTAKKTGSYNASTYVRGYSKVRHYYRCSSCKRRWTNDRPMVVRQKYFSPWDSFTWEWDINEPHEGEE